MMAIQAYPNNCARPSFHILTFGCQMNQRDSHWLRAALLDSGFRPETVDRADLVFLNTCSVRAKPEDKVMQTVGRIRSLTGGRARFVVLGCVAQQLGQRLLDDNKDILLVAGGANLDLVPQMLEEVLACGERKALLDFHAHYRERKKVVEPLVGSSAFINIMQGCDNFCSYCIVPFTRGRQRSRLMADIVAECVERLANGARELTLLGQNVNAWGSDLRQKDDFAVLLRVIGALPGLERLRFLTSHPRDFTSEMAACFADMEVLCPDLHLPLQAGSDRILKAMRRGYDSAAYLDLVAMLRKARPDIALRTDIIVGFPGETDEDFQATLAMMRACRFVSSYSFCYSDRPGTIASGMEGKIPKDIQLERLALVQDLQQQLTSEWLRERVGDEVPVLLESRSRRQDGQCWCGRDQWGAVINVPVDSQGAHAGEMVMVRIDTAKKNSLAGTLTEPDSSWGKR